MKVPYQAKIPTQNHNVSHESLITKSFQIIFSLFAFIIFISVTIYLSLGLLISFAPIDFGRILGNSIIKSFEADSSKKVYPRAADIQTIFLKLKTSSPELEKLELKIINDSKFQNAFALPGGIIVIGTGLINELKSEQEIAMILGHEIGHQVNRDSLRRMSKGLIFILLYSSVSFGGGEIPVASSLNNLLDLSFSRQQELAADDYGFELLKKVYHSPHGSSEAFESILNMEQKSSENKFFDLDILKTHPETEYRIKRLKEKTKE